VIASLRDEDLNMGLRFRHSFVLFPGVRLNLSGGGISATFGVPGASVNVGSRGVGSTVGIPGSGLSFSSNLTPNARLPGAPQYVPTPDANPPSAYWQSTQMREINSASVEQLTSEGLVDLRDMIAQARTQRREIETDLAEARAALDRDSTDLDRRQRSLFRVFYKRRIAELEESVPEAEQEIARLTEWLESTHIDISFETGDAAKKAYASLARTFDALRGCTKVWDVTSDRITNRVVERSFASRALSRTPVVLNYADSDLVRFAGRAMQFPNINGEDILIYPGIALMPREDGAFALIDLREIDLAFNGLQFVEDETVPPDSQVIGRTWAKVNKDGSPDLRFKMNYQIPICHYGRMVFTTAAGIEEEYQFSNANLANNFAVAFGNYQQALMAH